MKRKRKVKFVQRGTFPPEGDQRIISSKSTDGRCASYRDCPKTLEYKYFLRLVQEAGHGSHSHHLAQRGNNSSSRFKKDMINENVGKKEMTMQNLLAEEPAEENTLLLPTRRSGERNLRPINGETFCTKRQNLVKLAASVLSLEESEVKFKGNDLIPLLLHRLRMNEKFENSDEGHKNVDYPCVAYPEDNFSSPKPCETLDREEEFTENNQYSDWWKNADEISSLMVHKEEQFFPVWTTSESDFSAGQSCSYFLMDVLNPYPEDEHEEPIFDCEIFTNSTKSQRNLRVPLLSFDGMNIEREMPSNFEIPGENLSHQWPLTLYEDGCGGVHSNSPSPHVLQREEYLSSGLYKYSLSSCQMRSSSGRLLLGSAYTEAETPLRKRSFHLQEMDEGDMDEDDPSLISWMTRE